MKVRAKKDIIGSKEETILEGTILTVIDKTPYLSSLYYSFEERPDVLGYREDFFEEVTNKTTSSISDMFQAKVQSLQYKGKELILRPIQAGDKVYYDRNGTKENGIVKLVMTNNVFVVYRCGEDWENYRNYTGVLTPLNYLKKGWYDIHNERSSTEGREHLQKL